MNKDIEIIKKLDYALTMLIGIENVDLIYDAKNEKEIEQIIIELDDKNKD